MATIINNPGGESESSGVLFAVAMIVLLIAGAVLVMNYLPRTAPDAPSEPGINIDVVTPSAPAGGAAPAPAEPVE